MRATIARRHIEGIVRVMQKPENLEKHLRPAAPETEVRLLSDSADSGRLGGAQGQHRRRHRAAGGRLSVCAGRGGNQPLRRSAPAHRAGPHLPQKTPHPDTGRGHLRAGQHLRKAHPGRDRENERGMRHHGSLHRTPPFTLQNCDEIIVMDKGCIVQRGTCREPESAPGCFGTWRWGFANKLMKRVGFSPDAPLFYRFCWEIILMRPPARIMPR